jgi:hypothetical protein
MRTIEDLCLRSNAIAKEKGWYDGKDTDQRPLSLHSTLVHSEVSEALEEFREHRSNREVYFEVSDPERGKQNVSKEDMDRILSGPDPDLVFVLAKPAGIPVEIADVVIRIAQRTASSGKLLEAEVNRLQKSATMSRSVEDGLPGLLADMHVAIAMAYKCGTDSRWAEWLSRDGLPSSELVWFADAVWLAFDFCERSGVDLWAAIELKETYNRSRPQRHGNKKA